VSRDYLLLVFSLISFPQAPDYTIRAVSKFFQIYPEIFAAQGLPPVSATLAKMVEKFAAGAVDTIGAP
jgi:hypothetical protein